MGDQEQTCVGTTGGVEVTTLGGLGGRMERRKEWREEDGPHGRGSPVEAVAASQAASAAIVWRVVAAARTSLMLCVNVLMRLRIDLAFSRCRVTPRFW